MNPSNPFFFALVLFLTATADAATVKTNTGVNNGGSGASGASGSQNGSLQGSGPILSLNAPGLINLSLSPAAGSPLLKESAGTAQVGAIPTLPSSAINLQAQPAALNAAPSQLDAPQAAPAPPGPPKTPDSQAGGGGGGGPPYFVQSLTKLGVPIELATRLHNYQLSRHPGDQDKTYHGLTHSQDVPTLTAKVLEGQNLSDDKKILLILAAALHDIDPERSAGTPARVSATLPYLAKDQESVSLLSEFEKRYGFTPAQVKALIKATDFDMNPERLRAIQEEFRRGAAAAFGEEAAWAQQWGANLAFIDKSASYVGSIESAERQWRNLAYEIRNAIEAATGKPALNPTDDSIRQGSHLFLKELKDSAQFALLPADLQAKLNTVYAHAQKVAGVNGASGSPATASRAPPADASVLERAKVTAGHLEGDKSAAAAAPTDAERAGRYIRSIMGRQKPTPQQTAALMRDWLEQAGIDVEGPRAMALKREMLPSQAKAEEAKLSAVDPKFSKYGPMLVRLSEEYGVTPAHTEGLVKKSGFAWLLTSDLPKEQVERAVGQMLEREKMEKAVAPYPQNQQGRLMREIVSSLLARSGKSVEEIARSGVFVYTDFAGRRISNITVGRDPDPTSPQMIFYVEYVDAKWKISGYRQNRRTGSSDAELIDTLRSWLVAGGVPEGDFLR